MNIFTEIATILKEKNVNVYRVKIPSGSASSGYGMHCKTFYTKWIDVVECGDLAPPMYLERISDVKAADLKRAPTLYNTQMGDWSRTIFLVGACIVGGFVNPVGERLGDFLYTKLESLHMQYTLKFVPLILDGGEAAIKKEILEYSIKCNDIVIMIDYRISEWELDTDYIYQLYNGKKWLYQDEPIHTTITMNRMLADVLIEKIVKPIYDKSRNCDDTKIIYSGEPQFSVAAEKQIKKYTDKLKKLRHLSVDTIKGAIVMNCNPFTEGHRFLVKYASSKVDVLYLFLVEEDLSLIPFSDRLFMAYEGVKDISNVLVVPSGDFIISQNTFKDYFQKESVTYEIDAREDCFIFARYIAADLGITKRFVGQEPQDYVTNCYNQFMKQILPAYGVEVEEMPRKTTKDGNVISANTVRKLLMQDRMEDIGQYVPKSTLDYLEKIRETLLEREKLFLGKVESCGL